MLLEELIAGCDVLSIDGETKLDIKAIKINSNEVEEGDCFIALVGKRSDGHRFADEAIARGAKAVICCNGYSNSLATVVKVDDTRKAYSIMASNYYSNPSKKLKLITVVGTLRRPLPQGHGTLCHYDHPLGRFGRTVIGGINYGPVAG